MKADKIFGRRGIFLGGQLDIFLPDLGNIFAFPGEKLEKWE